MFILTGDERRIINLDKICAITKDKNHIIGVYDTTDEEVILGKYGTEEETREAFNDLCSILPKIYMKTNTLGD